jgi:GNAT superfamily N-acetyltransferase
VPLLADDPLGRGREAAGPELDPRYRQAFEAARVDSARRGPGIGQAMLAFAIDECRKRHCGLVQLTTDRARHDAHRFYERLGFVASHEGMKLALAG